MNRIDRRRAGRITCFGATALVGFGRRTISTVISDMSLRGLRLVGNDLPAPRASVAITILMPPQELLATGRVMWTDRARGMVGIELDSGTPRNRHDVRAAMLALGSEADSDQPAAALFVDDRRVAARLCVPLRNHGYLPCVVTTPLGATTCLTRDRPAVRFAIISPRTLGLAAADIVSFLAKEYPAVSRILIGDPRARKHSPANDVLSSAHADRELDSLLEHLVA